MKPTTKGITVGMIALITPFISVAHAGSYSPVGFTTKHFRARADFVPIKTWTRWRFAHHPKEFTCINQVFTLESHWNPKAYNRVTVMGLHAGGIPQILGLSIKDSPYLQVNAGISYIQRRYGSPCKALAFHRVYGWY